MGINWIYALEDLTMNRTRGILIAASLTGFVLITILALGFGRAKVDSTDNSALGLSAPQRTATGTSQASLQQQLEAWQKYGQELEQTVRIMQARESQYQQQLDSANQTIVQLQDEINGGNRSRARSIFAEREDHEYGEFDD
jgi:septal ring factor EnvC (AmiA/AmiB activator)